jgi:hypothetical protein
MHPGLPRRRQAIKEHAVLSATPPNGVLSIAADGPPWIGVSA